MSDHSKNVVIYRCPTCLNGGNDIYLVQEGDNYRCLKCSFVGKAEEIERMYAGYQAKYRLMGRRITVEEQINM